MQMDRIFHRIKSSPVEENRLLTEFVLKYHMGYPFLSLDTLGIENPQTRMNTGFAGFENFPL